MLNLKRIRVLKNISRYKLSKMTGLGESTLQNIENSKEPNPTFKTMCKIADALEISLDDLRKEWRTDARRFKYSSAQRVIQK